MQQDRWTWTLTGGTVACVAALYVRTVQRTVPGGDSGWYRGLGLDVHPWGRPLSVSLCLCCCSRSANHMASLYRRFRCLFGVTYWYLLLLSLIGVSLLESLIDVSYGVSYGVSCCVSLLESLIDVSYGVSC